MFSIKGKGIVLELGKPFEIDGVKYSSTWLQYATTEELNDAGIVEMPAPAFYDANFYFSDGSPRDLEDSTEVFTNEEGVEVEQSKLGLKTEWINRVNYNRNQLLANTDWYIIRKYERDVDIPTTVEEYRAAVHTEGTRLEEAILAATNVEDLKEVVTSQNWPILNP